MAFDKEPAKTPSRINRATIHVAALKAADGTVTVEGTLDVGVAMSDGSVVPRFIPDLFAHLTATQKTAITNFIQAMLTKAETEILP